PPRCSRRSLYTRTTRPTIRGAACIRAPPAPLFAAQPVYAHHPPHYSRRSLYTRTTRPTIRGAAD
ncbi:MAG TPA: hypothetical protein K8W11_06855, partial [Anaerotruncus colihominis]|nr:hypothetical protein [Anaerotruncus colihominis]